MYLRITEYLISFLRQDDFKGNNVYNFNSIKLFDIIITIKLFPINI